MIGPAIVQCGLDFAAGDCARRQGGTDHRQGRFDGEGYPKPTQRQGGHPSTSRRRLQSTRKNHQVCC